MSNTTTLPTIYEASIILHSNEKHGDASLYLRRIVNPNNRGWALGLEFIETNSEPVTENEEDFHALTEMISDCQSA